MLSELEKAEFRRNLLAWFARNRRDLPWRRTRDPYAIWVSEIMLQQTRVAAARPYYERFLARFPDYASLAAAEEADLLAHWAGLGYYCRARNLRRAAHSMVQAGRFPSAYESIRALPGVGEYTAAAVASIAFDLPHAVVDGNVFRVVSRVLADNTNIASAAAREHFGRIAEALLDRAAPGSFNQAMMELGATVCLPASPQCLLCPVSGLCKARAEGTQQAFPVKIKPQRSVREERTVFWIERGEKVLAWRRAADSRLMPGFWELPESAHLPNAVESRLLGTFRHTITYHNYVFHVREASLPRDPERNDTGPCEWLPLSAIPNAPTSTILRKAKKIAGKAAQSAGTTHRR